MTPADESKGHPSLTPGELYRRFSMGQQVFWTSSGQNKASALTIDIDVRRGKKKLEVGTRWLKENVNRDIVRRFEEANLYPVLRSSGRGVYVEYFFKEPVPYDKLDILAQLTVVLFKAIPVAVHRRGLQPPVIHLRRGRKTITFDMVSTHALTRLPGSVHHLNGKISHWAFWTGGQFKEVVDIVRAVDIIRQNFLSEQPDLTAFLSALYGQTTTPILSLSFPLPPIVSRKVHRRRASSGKPLPKAQGTTSIERTSNSWKSASPFLSSGQKTLLKNHLIDVIVNAKWRGPTGKKRVERIQVVVSVVVNRIARIGNFRLALRELSRKAKDTDTKQVATVLQKVVDTGIIIRVNLPSPGAGRNTQSHVPRTVGSHTIRRSVVTQGSRPMGRYQANWAIIYGIVIP